MANPPPDDRVDALAPGAAVDRYVVEAVIGTGGMAVVYRVRHAQLGGTYALKVLSTGGRAVRARLLQEGRAQSTLRHPNVVAVHDVVDVGGAPGLVMDLIDGPTLGDLLAQGPLTLPQVDRIGRDLLRGVAAAHRHGLVHRDLKPGNVLMAIGDDGLVAKVADFGLAKVLREEGDHGITRSGATMGTPAYMAPEQIRDASKVDGRADVFALGAVLYELVTGRRAFGGLDTLELFTAIAAGRYLPVRSIRADVPDRMEAAIVGALQPDPAARIADVDALLRAWTGDAQVVSQPDAWSPAAIAAAKALRARGEGAARTSSSTFDVGAVAAEVAAAGAVDRRRASLKIAAVVVGVALAAGLVWVAWPDPPAPVYVPVIDRFTHEVGYQVQPAISPDGKQIVYTDGTDLWLRRVGGTKVVPLTADFAPIAKHPAWSPDGEHLAFTGDGALYVAGALGEEPKRLVDVGQQPAWSPDGRSIAFATEELWDPQARLSYRSVLRVVDVATGVVRDVLVGKDAILPAWSPSGQRIAVTAMNQLATVNADGSDYQVLDPGVWSASWGSDGAIWGLATRGDTTAVVRIPVDEATGLREGPLEEAFPMAIGAMWNLTMSADGRRLAVDTVSGSSQIFSVAIDPTTGALQGPPLTVTSGSRSYGGPAVSPDGTRLAYTSESFGEDLFVADVDGSNVHPLSTGATYTRGATWSPDGAKIAFYGRRDGQLGIWTVNADGGELQRLGHAREGFEFWVPRWSPDGTRMAVSQESVQPFVIRLDRPWAPQVAVDPRPENAGWIATDWSPDGRWIAVSDARGRIGKMDPDTLVIETLSDVGYYPIWLRDSKTLLVAVDQRVFTLDSETRAVQDVLSIAPAKVPATPSLALSPDGATVFFAASTSDADVWIVDLVVR